MQKPTGAGGGKGSPFAALGELAPKRASDAVSAGKWDEALEWLDQVPPGHPFRQIEALVRYRQAGCLLAKGDWLDAQALLATAARHSAFPAYLIEERQRLARLHGSAGFAGPAIIGNTCERCDGHDLYVIATCTHQRDPLPPTLKLRPTELQPRVKSTYAVGAYRPGWDRERESAVSALIRRTKDRIDPVSMQWLGALLVDFVRAHTPLPGIVDAVVPVPTSGEREQRRGGALPSMLAAALRDGLALPMREPLVQIAEHRDHTQAHGAERRAGLRAAWRHAKDPVLVGRSVLLVDDIMTTGTTLRTAAEMLQEGDVAEVHAVTLLHTERSS